MMTLQLAWIIDALKDQLIEQVNTEGFAKAALGVSTDSRSIGQDEVFIALQGPNFDGHQFVEQVAQNGACMAIVNRRIDSSLPQLVVRDTLVAYGHLARAWRQQCQAKIVAVTGSVGKTTVKEMLASILAGQGQTLATQGNFNNEIGVPKTLFRLSPQDKYAAIELGANHIGEIAYTVSLTEPDVAILNNVGQAHLEGFGSLLGVVQAKGEIFTGLKSGGTAVVNGDSEYAHIWLSALRQRAELNVIEFSTQAERVSNRNTCVGVIDGFNEQGCASFTLHFNGQSWPVTLAIPGAHNVANACAAAAACFALGLNASQIIQGLSNLAKVKGRVELHSVANQHVLIDDSYNANVRSVEAAIDLLSNYQGYRVLVLGDMAELGDEAQRYHREIGDYAAKSQIDEVMTVGQLSRFVSQQVSNGHHFESQADIVAALQSRFAENKKVVALVKGSRSAAMERIVEQINNNNNKGIHSC